MSKLLADGTIRRVLRDNQYSIPTHKCFMFNEAQIHVVRQALNSFVENEGNFEDEDGISGDELTEARDVLEHFNGIIAELANSK